MGAMAAYQRADVLLEQHGDRTAAEASYRRVDQRGDANGTFNLTILEEQGDHIGALRAYQRAEQLGHPEIADMARAAVLDLKRQSESLIAVRQGGGHDGPRAPERQDVKATDVGTTATATSLPLASPPGAANGSLEGARGQGGKGARIRRGGQWMGHPAPGI